MEAMVSASDMPDMKQKPATHALEKSDLSPPLINRQQEPGIGDMRGLFDAIDDVDGASEPFPKIEWQDVTAEPRDKLGKSASYPGAMSTRLHAHERAPIDQRESKRLRHSFPSSCNLAADAEHYEHGASIITSDHSRSEPKARRDKAKDHA